MLKTGLNIDDKRYIERLRGQGLSVLEISRQACVAPERVESYLAYVDRAAQPSKPKRKRVANE